MKKRLIYSLLLVLSSLVLLNCNREKQIVVPHTLEIFPAETGKFRITYVRDTTFTTAGRDKGIGDVYFKRETVSGQEEDLLGRTINAIQVFRSDSFLYPDYDFQPDRVYTQYLEPQTTGDYYAERIEENQRFLVLKFPAFEDVRWNGNQFNNFGPQEFRYHTIDTNVVIRGITYENCVMVVQKADTNNFISDKFAYEIYAPGIGLVKKYDYTIVNDGPQGEFNPDESRVYIEEIEAYN
ncbi:MAG: hypothetical protein AAF927_11550 [Bacteroidota bacterium]